MNNYFEKLSSIDVNAKTEKKGKLSYLSWAWAWSEIKKLHPTSNYIVYENAHGWNYHTDGKTAWVKVGVTINEIEHVEYLPVMDNMNKSIALEKVTSFDVNKAIQRAVTKAIGRHGLGLYIYAGEDLPEQQEIYCEECEKEITSIKTKDGIITAKEIAEKTKKQYAMALCMPCAKEIHDAIKEVK